MVVLQIFLVEAADNGESGTGGGGMVAQVEGYVWMQRRWLAAAGEGGRRREKAVAAVAAATAGGIISRWSSSPGRGTPSAHQFGVSLLLSEFRKNNCFTNSDPWRPN